MKRVSQYEFPAAKSFWRKLSSFITARLCQKLIRSAIGNPDSALENCQGGDLNSRPRAYESPALPLSYPGFYFVQKSLANSLKRPTPNAFGAALAPSYPCEIGGDKAQSHDLRCQRERKSRISFPTLFPARALDPRINDIQARAYAGTRTETAATALVQKDTAPSLSLGLVGRP